MLITRCQVNHLTNPLGYHIEQPVFSYQVEEATGYYQTEARLVIAVDEQLRQVVLDTGFTVQIDSLGYVPDLDLQPRTRYYWTMTVRSDAGEEATSPVNWFETAKMTEPWQAAWITCDASEPRHPIFCRDIAVDRKLLQARLYICGLGLYEAALNGRRIGDEYLTPYCNDYNTWLQYQTCDITADLQDGGRLEVTLGNGWYLGRFGFISRPGQPGFYAKTFKLIAEIHLDYTDGSHQVIGTDESWLVKRSKITFSNIYDGECEDATLSELPAAAALLCHEQLAGLTARLSTPVKIREELPARELLRTPAGEWVYHIGQNLAGSFRLRVDVPAGTRVHLQFGEILQQGNFYRDNLRSAKAEYIWISDGRPTVLQPHFTFYGYQYVKVEGVENLQPGDFTALALYSEIPAIGSLKTGHPLVNQLISNIIWGQKGNFLDVPTDCPQRDERMGWTGDAQVFSSTALYLTDSSAFYRKYLWDMQQEQAVNDGKVPDVIPSVGVVSCSTVWGDATCIIPWNIYLFTGDSSILREHFTGMRAWVDYLTAIDGDNHAWRSHFHYGDWLALDHPSGGDDQTQGATDKGFIADVYYRHSALLVAKSARVLGLPDIARQYEELGERILRDLKLEYFSATDRCCIDTQTAHLLTLRYGLAQNRDKALKALEKCLSDASGKLKTGFVGTPLLCNVLSDEGRHDLAFGLLLNEDYPGWLYSVKLGATTVWERWNSVLSDGSISSTGMNSLNHYAYGSIGDWLFRHVAGLAPDESAPGFRKAIITPNPHRKLTEAQAVYNSAAGIYKSSWRIIGKDNLEISLTIPFGCTAQVYLPFVPDSVFQDKSNPLFAQVVDGCCRVGPGSYSVSYETSQPLHRIYNTSMPLRELMQDADVRNLLAKKIPAMPDSMMDMSLRQIGENFGHFDASMTGQLDALDQALAEL